MSAKIVPIEICLSRSPTYGNLPFRIFTAQHKYMYFSRLSCERPTCKMVFWKTFQTWIDVLWICIEKYREVVEGKNEGKRCCVRFYCRAITYGRPAHSYILSRIPLPNHTRSILIKTYILYWAGRLWYDWQCSDQRGFRLVKREFLSSQINRQIQAGGRSPTRLDLLIIGRPSITKEKFLLEIELFFFQYGVDFNWSENKSLVNATTWGCCSVPKSSFAWFARRYIDNKYRYWYRRPVRIYQYWPSFKSKQQTFREEKDENMR